MSLPPLPQTPFDDLVGIKVVEAAPDRVVALLPVRAELLQPHGIVHGGVYATIVETVASIGANLSLHAMGLDAHAVGVTNTTDFIRATVAGELRAEATPLQRGRTRQLWQVAVTDTEGRLAAHGKVTLLAVPSDGDATRAGS